MLPSDRSRCRLAIGVGLIVLCFAHSVEAQHPRAADGPKPGGLLLPDAPGRLGDGRPVQVNGPGGKSLVGKVYAEVADWLVVQLPNGELMSLPAREAKNSDAAFQPATKTELIEELTAKGPLKGFKVRNTNRFLYVYNTSDEFYSATSRILETMYPGLYEFFRRQRIDVHNPDTLLVVIMFRTQAEFERYRPMPSGVVAYYDSITNRVVMYEQSKLSEVAPELAVKQSISTIAHEGVHQVLHNIGVQHRLSDWPMWFSEGLAEYFSPTSTDRQVRWKGVAQVNDMRMFELERYFNQTDASSAQGNTIRLTVGANGLSSTGYASAWALTHFLAQRRKEKFFAYLKDVCEIGPLQKDRSDNMDLFSKHFGNDLASLERDMVKHLQGLPYTRPDIAKMTGAKYFVGFIEYRTGGTVRRISSSVLKSAADARKDAQDRLGSIPVGDRASARITIGEFNSASEAIHAVTDWMRGR